MCKFKNDGFCKYFPLQKRAENTSRYICDTWHSIEFQYHLTYIDIFEFGYIRLLWQCVHITTSVCGDFLLQFSIRIDAVFLDRSFGNSFRMFCIGKAYRGFSSIARRQGTVQ